MPVSLPTMFVAIVVAIVKKCLLMDVQFKDDLIKLGLEGGKKAAQLLKQAVEQLLKSSDSSAAPTHHLQVIIRVYANLKGLSGTYNDMEVLSEHTFSEFVSGFNMGDVLCDYVDAGSGKECSDEKVKAIFRFHLDDVHCQQILFGGSADNGYARLLGPYVEHDALRARVVLIEGPPFAQELAAIKDKFRTVSLESVFRNQKLVNAKRKVSFGVTPPATPANATAYALVAAQAHFINTSLPAATTAQKSPAPSAKAVQSTPPVYRNKQNERVDAPLRYSQEEFMNLKGRKLCNNYHLLGKCGAFDSFRECHHEHGKPLSESQKAALRALARQAPCQAGLDCDDPRCIWGHRCLRMNCIREICWFSPEMHNVDTKVVT